MGLQSVDGNSQKLNTVGQYDELLRGLDAQKLREGKGTEGSKAVNTGLGLGDQSVVITKALENPANPIQAGKTGESAPTTASRELEGNYAKLDQLVHQFMDEYGLTEEQCYGFAEEVLYSTNPELLIGSNPKAATAANNFLQGVKSAPQTTTGTDNADTGNDAKTVTVTHQKVMFDLYALLTLLQETAQKERNASREIRRTQSQAIQNTILDQAHLQKVAAIVGLVCGAISFLVSLGQMIHNATQTTRGVKQEDNLRNELGVNTASTEFKAVQTQAKPVLESRAALKQAEVALEKQCTPEQASEFKQLCADGHATKGEILQQLEDRHPQAEANPLEVELEDVDANVENPLTDKQYAAAKDYVTKFFDHKTLMDNGGQAKLDAVDNAKNTLATRTELMKSTTDYREAMKLQDQQGVRNMNYLAVTKLLEAGGQTVSGIINSNATAKGAQVKQAEEELEQVKDLFKQYEDVLQNVLSTRKSIQQAESQTIQGMFRA